MFIHDLFNKTTITESVNYEAAAPMPSAHKEVDMEKWMRAYTRREDNNLHSENSVALAKLVGNERDIKLAKMILKDHLSRGHITRDDYEARQSLDSRLWPLAVQKYEQWKSDNTDDSQLSEAYHNDIKHAWNSGMSEEELIQRFGRGNVEALKRKYGDNSIPTDEVRGYRSSNRVPEDPRVRAHRGLDGMGKRLKDIIKHERTNESLRDGEYYVYEVTFDDGTTTKIRTSNDWFDAKTYYAKRGKNVVKSERIGGIQGGDYIPPKKPHQFPDDSFARAQRAYDRQEPKEGVAEGSEQRWLIKIWDGNSNREIERKGSYEQVKNSLAGLPHSHIVSIEPIEQKGVEEGYQDDSKEREENLRYDRSRNPVAADIRKKLNPNREFSEREIQQWASKSPENQKIYNAYIKASKLADKAYAEKDGASSTGLQVLRKQIRDLIAQKMSDNSENKDVE